MQADDALSAHSSPQEYQLPQRDLLTAEAEKAHSAQIQGVVSRFVAHLESTVLGLPLAGDLGGLDRQEIAAAVSAGLRAATVSYFANPASPHTIFRQKAIDSVCQHVRDVLLEHLAASGNIDDTLLRWFGHEQFRKHLPDTTRLAQAVAAALNEIGPSVREMVEANMRLVRNVARTFKGRGMTPLDFWQEGTIALHEAALSFDPSQGAFSTFATLLIRRRFISSNARLRAQRTAWPDKFKNSMWRKCGLATS